MKQTAFVTGATGFLGRHLIDVLVEKGFEITALVRSPEKAAAILGGRVNLVQGDLTDLQSIENAMPDHVDAVFHAAADTSSWYRDNDQQSRINIDGTANMLRTALDKQSGRFVHVSSVSVFGHHADPITEASEKHGFGSWINYVHSKTVAERKVREAIERGMEAVIVNPTHIIGRYDNQNWARLIIKACDGSLPGIPPGGGNFANGRAVAEGTVAAFEHGRAGSNYILGGPFATFGDFLEEVSIQTGISLTAKPVPAWLLNILAQAGHWQSKLTGKRPNLTLEEAAFAVDTEHASSDKAVAELGYREVALADSVGESIAYLREEGLLDQ